MSDADALLAVLCFINYFSAAHKHAAFQCHMLSNCISSGHCAALLHITMSNQLLPLLSPKAITPVPAKFCAWPAQVRPTAFPAAAESSSSSAPVKQVTADELAAAKVGCLYCLKSVTCTCWLCHFPPWTGPQHVACFHGMRLADVAAYSSTALLISSHMRGGQSYKRSKSLQSIFSLVTQVLE